MLRGLERLTAGFLCFLAALAPGCAGPGGASAAPPPVAPAASAAFAEARVLLANGADPDDGELRAAVGRARLLAPDWVAPARLEDDLELRALRAVPALAARRLELRRAREENREEGELARLEYLTGRLDQGDGAGYFAHAASLDPNLAWAHHGLAFEARRSGDAHAAVQHQRRALRFARDPWERAWFAVTLARFLVEDDREEAAVTLLRDELATLELAPHDRTWLAFETALIETRQSSPEDRARGYERALSILRERDLTATDLARLVASLRVAGIEHDWRGARLTLAVATRDGPGREQELTRLLLERGDAGTRIGLGLHVRADELAAERGDAGPRSSVSRLGWFSAGRYAEGVERWLADLPAQVLDEHGMPREPRLAAIVEHARSHAAASGAREEGRALIALCEALLDAGWFDEARRAAEGLAALELDPALDLALRALAGAELIEGIERLARDVDDGERVEGWALGAPAQEEVALEDAEPAVQPAGDLDALLVRMAELVARANRFLGGTENVAELEETLLASPRLGYARFAQLVHPGPWFSAEDEELGRGPRGEPVPGLAQLMQRLGRFATFGQVLGGGGPDGIVLRRLWVERRAGEHLGVPWSGTIAWCEGADLGSRASLAGANISGAAVHEGYWVNIQVLRPEFARWRAVAARFDGAAEDEAARRRLERALAPGGLPIDAWEPDGVHAVRARVELDPMLDQADRLRLTVLAERAPPGRLLGEMAFEELVQGVAIHEEGHMVDRALHVPVLANPGRVMRILFDAGFTVRGVQRLLEYRAQLLALCVSPDPRLPLVDLLEIGGAAGHKSLLEHARAYRNLLQDLVNELERASRSNPDQFPTIDRTETLLHQLHRLDPETIRALSLRLAKRQGVGR